MNAYKCHNNISKITNDNVHNYFSINVITILVRLSLIMFTITYLHMLSHIRIYSLYTYIYDTCTHACMHSHIPTSLHYCTYLHTYLRTFLLAPCELILENCNLEKSMQKIIQNKNAKTNASAKTHCKKMQITNQETCRCKSAIRIFVRICLAFYRGFCMFFLTSCLSSWSLV